MYKKWRKEEMATAANILALGGLRRGQVVEFAELERLAYLQLLIWTIPSRSLPENQSINQFPHLKRRPRSNFLPSKPFLNRKMKNKLWRDGYGRDCPCFGARNTWWPEF
jgi:hypothetical protein